MYKKTFNKYSERYEYAKDLLIYVKIVNVMIRKLYLKPLKFSLLRAIKNFICQF